MILTDLIAEKLSEKLSVSSPPQPDTPKEEVPTEEAAFDAALNFLNNF